MLHNTTQHNTTQHNTTQHNTTQHHHTLQHNTTTHHNTAQQQVKTSKVYLISSIQGGDDFAQFFFVEFQENLLGCSIIVRQGQIQSQHGSPRIRNFVASHYELYRTILLAVLCCVALWCVVVCCVVLCCVEL